MFKNLDVPDECVKLSQRLRYAMFKSGLLSRAANNWINR